MCQDCFKYDCPTCKDDHYVGERNCPNPFCCGWNQFAEGNRELLVRQAHDWQNRDDYNRLWRSAKAEATGRRGVMEPGINYCDVCYFTVDGCTCVRDNDGGRRLFVEDR